MKNVQKNLVTIGVLGVLVFGPFVAIAEEQGSELTPETTAVPTLYDDRIAPEQESPQQNAPLMMRNNLEKPAPTLIRQREEAQLSPEEKQVRMMASGTKPLPPKLERAMEVRDERMASATDRRQEIKDKIEERKEQARERVEARHGEIMKRLATKLATRMEAAITRLSKLADRVDSRIAKLTEAGRDASAASMAIEVTREKLSEASLAVESAKASIDDSVTRTNDKTVEDASKPVREALETAKQAVMAAHKALVEAIKSLKASVKIDVAEDDSSTSTATN